MRRKPSVPFIAGSLLPAGLALLIPACGAASPSSSTAGTKPTTATTPDIRVGNSSLGQVLTDKAGFTLYYFTPEQGSKLVCDSGSCLDTWPLVDVSGTPSAASAVSGRLTTISAPGGVTEVVYNGWPLHTYIMDTKPGDTKGQGIAGKWFAATPSLTAAGAGASAGASASPTGTYNPY